jgi:hypothetical protein
MDPWGGTDAGERSFADRLQLRRHQLFVGRDCEREAFRRRLQAQQPGVLFIHGQGGVGKTTLLHELAYLCREAGVRSLRLDCGQIDARPAALLSSLAEIGETPLGSLGDLRTLGARVLMLDSFESLAPMEGWFRESFLPGLPDDVLVVLAGREPPSEGWRSDAGWHLLLERIALEELSAGESRQYLTRRGIPDRQQRAVLSFTRGHALALSLVADLFAQAPNTEFSVDNAPDVVRALVAQLLRELPDPAQRAALEACAVAHTTTEPLLAALLETPDVHAHFAWLRGLSFMQTDRAGLFPHKLARKALLADLVFRDPARLRQLQERALTYLVSRSAAATPAEWRASALECMYSIFQMFPPSLRSLFRDGRARGLAIELATVQDQRTLIAMVERHEGPGSAAIARHWFARQPHNVTVIRDSTADPAGFFMTVSLDRLDEEDRRIDPAIARALDYLAGGRLPAGRTAVMARFAMARDTYQQSSPAMLVCASLVSQIHVATPQLGYSFISLFEWEPFSHLATLGGFVRTPELDYEVGGRRYGMFAQDWRYVSPIKFLAQLAQNGHPGSPERTTTFTTDLFADGVRLALRHLHEPHRLIDNPLLNARVVIARAGVDAPSVTRAEALRALVCETVQRLDSSPRNRKLHAALDATFVNPVGTQEDAAEELDLPFGTYRRHLNEGTTAVVELLWRQESGR